MCLIKFLYFLTEIIDKAEHFYCLSSIYDKHKAKGLGETCGNISTFPLALLFIHLAELQMSDNQFVESIPEVRLLSTCLTKYISLLEAFSRYESLHFPRTKAVIQESLMNGKVGQIENPLKIFLRNHLIRRLPSKSTVKLLDKYFAYDVTKVAV